MSKKRVQFDLDEKDEEQAEQNQEENSKLPFNKKFKHTLDSDESDDELIDEKKYELDQNEFDGEEEGNLHNEGEIVITPFNVKDELKEGYFDQSGTFIFKKDQDEIKDNWIDNIDWAKIKEVDKTDGAKKKEEVEEKAIDEEECLKKLIDLMNPNETVQRAMQRLGKSKIKNLNRNRNKNRQRLKEDGQSGTSGDEKQLEEEQEENVRKENLNSLIEMSNYLLSNGDMNIYETKYETLKYQLDEKLKAKQEALDMFSD